MLKKDANDNRIEIALPPERILKDPTLNKGTAFTHEERKELGLTGFLPYAEMDIQTQIHRRYLNFKETKGAFARYRLFKDLRERNEVLYFRMILEYVDEVLPYIYTPMVGEAAQKFSAHYTHHRGIFFSYPFKDQIQSIVDHIPQEDIRVIVITDGGRILGLGDMGAGGMAIPIGKLDLYCLFAGIHPSHVLPVMLDVGTDNPELLEDDLYVGYPHHRIKGEAYDQFVDEVVNALMKRYPQALLQWEDFPKDHARTLLYRYQDQFLSFNDDIQGTAAAVLAGIKTALKSSKQKLGEQNIAILGGGSAGIGVAQLIVEAMKREGLDEGQARRQLYIVDVNGLLLDHHKGLDESQKAFAHLSDSIKTWEIETIDHVSLFDVVRSAKPSILIGLSSQTGAFTEDIIKMMASNSRHPIILPLSNPTSKSEAHPADVLKWTEGRALIATGSPFNPVLFEGLAIDVAQCNNVYVFPGLGLGLIIVGAKKVTTEMFLVAVEVLSDYASEHNPTQLFPEIKHLREASKQIAIAVAKYVIEMGLATLPIQEDEIEEKVDAFIWYPEYPHFKRPL